MGRAGVGKSGGGGIGFGVGKSGGWNDGFGVAKLACG